MLTYVDMLRYSIQLSEWDNVGMLLIKEKSLGYRLSTGSRSFGF